MSPALRAQVSALLLAAWIGAALITVAVVAPGAFEVLPSRTMAGAMVGRVLPTVFILGMVISILVAALARDSRSGKADRRVAAAAVVTAIACGISQFTITPRLARLRAEIGGPIDALRVDDARRVAFGMLHGYNVAGLGVAMLGAVVCLGFLFSSLRSRA